MTEEKWYLGYHYISLTDENPGGPTCVISRFEKQLDFIRSEGYKVLPLSEVVERMLTDRPLPPRIVTISFDDNLRSGYTNAYPLLKKYGFPATYFVITSTLFGKIPPVIQIQLLAEKIGGAELERLLTSKLDGTAYKSLMDTSKYDTSGHKLGEPKPERRRTYWVFCHLLPFSLQFEIGQEMFEEVFGADLTADIHQKMFIRPEEIHEMLRNGMEVASHSVNHPLLSSIAIAELKKEAEESRNHLRDFFGKPPVEIFGYPFGGVFPRKVLQGVMPFYAGAYNYNNASAMPDGGYDRYDIPRLNEATASLFSALE